MKNTNVTHNGSAASNIEMGSFIMNKFRKRQEVEVRLQISEMFCIHLEHTRSYSFGVALHAGVKKASRRVRWVFCVVSTTPVRLA